MTDDPREDSVPPSTRVAHGVPRPTPPVLAMLGVADARRARGRIRGVRSSPLGIVALLAASMSFAAASEIASAPASAATQAAPDPGPAPHEAAPIRIEVEPFLDLWFAARSAGAAESGGPELLAGVAETFRAAARDFGSPLAWGPIEGRIATCKSVADARTALAEVTETLERRGLEPIALRARALELVDALAGIETKFRDELWPADEARIRVARDELEKGLLAHADEVFARHARALGFEGLAIEIPCVLVAKLPEPGAITHRGLGGRGVCFVGVDGLAGSALAEVVLHEATHALDVAKDDDLFDRLRARLEASGVARTDKLWRDAPHTVMFCASAETVRRTLDREHVDHGVASGYYAKVGATAAAIRTAWAEVESKQLGLDEAVAVLAAAVVPAGVKPPKKE